MSNTRCALILVSWTRRYRIGYNKLTINNINQPTTVPPLTAGTALTTPGSRHLTSPHELT